MYLQELLGPKPRICLVLDQECLYLNLLDLFGPKLGTLEAYMGPNHVLGTLPWHQPAWSQTKNLRRLLGALGYLLGSYSALVN